jgi:hypothetical protein
MALMENLEEQDLETLKSAFYKIKETNEKATLKTFDMEAMDLITVVEKIDALERKIDLIFGGSKLINGQWVDIEKQT